LDGIAKVCFPITLDLSLSLAVPFSVRDLHLHRSVMQLKRVADAFESCRLAEPGKILLCNLDGFGVGVSQVEAVPNVPTFMIAIEYLKLKL
jgi:hypothetical protein